MSCPNRSRHADPIRNSADDPEALANQALGHLSFAMNAWGTDLKDRLAAVDRAFEILDKIDGPRGECPGPDYIWSRKMQAWTIRPKRRGLR